jgi:hypothetical protein
MEEYFIHCIFIILEYIAAPFLAIFFSLLLKKKGKKRNDNIKELLQELDIEIRIISSLCMFNFALNNLNHNEGKSMDVERIGWMGIVVALVIIVYLLLSPATIKSDLRYDRNPRYFGLTNSNLPSSTYTLAVLIVYVLFGFSLKTVFTDPKYGGIEPQHIWQYIVILLGTIVALILLFFWFVSLLNLSVQRLVIYHKSYERTFSNAIDNNGNKGGENKKEEMEDYSLLISTLNNYKHKTNEMYKMLIEAYNHLCQIFKTNKSTENFIMALSLIDRVVAIYRDPNVNQEIENVNDALVEKGNIYKEFNKAEDAKKYFTELLEKEPANKRFQFELGKLTMIPASK